MREPLETMACFDPGAAPNKWLRMRPAIERGAFWAVFVIGIALLAWALS